MLLGFQGKCPKVDDTAFIAGNSLVIGDVEIGAGANVWFFSLLRADVNAIRVGEGCNIQDGCILHVARRAGPLIMGNEVVLGHRVTLHGCQVGRGAMIGIGATVLDGALIGEESMVGAGALVTPGTVVPRGTLALGTPARVVRDLTEGDFALIRQIRETYRVLMEAYRGIRCS